MKLASSFSIKTDPGEALQECHQQLLDANLAEISWLGVFHTDNFDSAVVLQNAKALFHSVPIHGGTSCMGVMSPQGYHCNDGYGMGILAISDPEGSYGVGAADIGDDPANAAAMALERALENADRSGEIPALVFMTPAPGQEEMLIQGIENVIGPSVPVAGGSTGDNTVSGNWRQFTTSEVYNDAVVLSVFFPSVEIAYAFHSGYDPTQIKGIVTKIQGRTLMEIDGRPAAEVYNEWTNGLIQDELSAGGKVLAKTTLSPLGREVGRVGNVPYYKLSHPDQVISGGGLTTFSDIDVGNKLILMEGSRNSLVARAGRVTSAAVSAGNFSKNHLIGAIVIYCAGCMLTVRDNMDQVAQEIDSALQDAPFLGIFTFGEQGCFVGNENSHGNLMISVVVFSDVPVY